MPAARKPKNRIIASGLAGVSSFGRVALGASCTCAAGGESVAAMSVMGASAGMLSARKAMGRDKRVTGATQRFKILRHIDPTPRFVAGPPARSVRDQAKPAAGD